MKRLFLMVVGLGLTAPFAAAQPLEAPVLGRIALRMPEAVRADTEWVVHAHRPQWVACLLAAHARAALAEMGQITINLRVHFGEVQQAATILRPPRADLARCLHNQVKRLRLAATAEVFRIRLTADWFAPPPPEQAHYPYPVRRP